MLEQHRFPVKSAISTLGSIDEAPQLFSAWSADPGRFTKDYDLSRPDLIHAEIRNTESTD